MSKQFSIIATDVDMLALEHVLKERGDVEFLSTKALPGTTELLPLNSIVLPAKEAGKQSLFCFLKPRNIPTNLTIRRLSEVKVSVDLESSYVIDFWRSFYDGNVIRPGRMYYQNKIFLNDEWKNKDIAFCKWADSIMATTKKLFPFDKTSRVRMGPDAAKNLAEGKTSFGGQ